MVIFWKNIKCSRNTKNSWSLNCKNMTFHIWHINIIINVCSKSKLTNFISNVLVWTVKIWNFTISCYWKRKLSEFIIWRSCWFISSSVVEPEPFLDPLKPEPWLWMRRVRFRSHLKITRLRNTDFKVCLVIGKEYNLCRVRCIWPICGSFMLSDSFYREKIIEVSFSANKILPNA